MVTEFIGITLAAGYLGVPKLVAVVLAAGVILAAAFTGSFRRFERIAVTFCAGSLLLIPLVLLTHPSGAQMAHGFVVPGLPGGSGQMATVMLLIIGIVGTTVAPWQLFFQQSYVVDKRITPRFIRYEKVDLWIGIVIVVVGAAAVIGATAAAFAGTKGAGNFTDAAGIAHGIAAYAGGSRAWYSRSRCSTPPSSGRSRSRCPARTRSATRSASSTRCTAGSGQAKGFYAIYAALIARRRGHRADPRRPARAAHRGRSGAGRRAAAEPPRCFCCCCVTTARSSARGSTAVRRPCSPRTVIALLVALSVVLTASVLFPGITERQIIEIFWVRGGCRSREAAGS